MTDPPRLVTTIYLAIVEFEDGGPCCGESKGEAEIFATKAEAQAFVTDTLRRTLAEADIYHLDDAAADKVSEAYLDAADDGYVPAATWNVVAKCLDVVVAQ